MDGLTPNTPTPQVPEPVAPVAPAPIAPEPVAPVTPLEPISNEDADQQEWDAAHDEVFPGLASNNPEFNKDEQVTTTTTETTQAPETTTTTTTVAPAPGPDGDNPSGESTPQPTGSDKPNGETPSGTETPAVNPVLTPQEYQKQQNEMRDDIKAKLFADAPTDLRASDGGELNTLDQVMQYENPVTGELFTQEEAGAFLLSATQKLNQDIQQREKDVERIADLNLDITTEANKITAKYGELLNKDPELKAKLWGDFSKTTTVKKGKNADGKEIDIIVNAPLSLEAFYENALGPRAEAAKITADATAVAAKKVVDDAAAAEQVRNQQRQDRSDIYTPGTPDIRDDDDKEWEEAHKEVFGDNFQDRIK